MTDQPGLGEARRRVASAADALATRAVEAIGDLIRVPSVDPSYPGVDHAEHLGGEARANQLLARSYEAAGCRVEWVEIAAQRPNLIGLVPGHDPDHGRSLILNGHVDVVPAGRSEDWTGGDPWSCRLAD